MMKEIRALPVTLEARKADDTGKRTIAGRIAYNEESGFAGYVGDPFIEELAPGCFDRALKHETWRDCGAMISAESGNTRNGTLRLASSDNQLTLSWTCRTPRRGTMPGKASSAGTWTV